MEQCKAAGLVQGEAVLTDSTHVKANASQDSKEIVVVTKTPREYWVQLEGLAEQVDTKKREIRGGGGKRGPKPGPRTQGAAAS